MTREIDACTCHLQLLDKAVRQVIADLHLTELSIGTVLHEVGRCTVFVSGIIGCQCRDATAGVGCCPSTQHTVTLVRSCIGDAVEVGLELLVVVHILTGNTLPEHVEVEVLVAQHSPDRWPALPHGSGRDRQPRNLQ